MVEATIAIISFLSGAVCAVYCLRLGMMWTPKETEKPQSLPLTPFERPPDEGEAPKEDNTMARWFEGGEER